MKFLQCMGASSQDTLVGMEESCKYECVSLLQINIALGTQYTII